MCEFRPGRAGFQDRVASHDPELDLCREVLERHGFDVQQRGQETQSGPWQAVAHRLHDDPTARAERFRPDLLASHEEAGLLLKVEVKGRAGRSRNIAIEKACHDNACTLRANGERVAYWFPGGRMEWPDALVPCAVIDDPIRLAACKRRGGSGTPFILIPDEDVKTTADDFLVAILKGDSCQRR